MANNGRVGATIEYQDEPILRTVRGIVFMAKATNLNETIRECRSGPFSMIRGVCDVTMRSTPKSADRCKGTSSQYAAGEDWFAIDGDWRERCPSPEGNACCRGGATEMREPWRETSPQRGDADDLDRMAGTVSIFDSGHHPRSNGKAFGCRRTWGDNGTIAWQWRVLNTIS